MHDAIDMDARKARAASNRRAIRNHNIVINGAIGLGVILLIGGLAWGVIFSTIGLFWCLGWLS